MRYMSDESAQELVKSIVKTCFILTRYQIRNKCFGDSLRGKCKPACVVYQCRFTQCTGEVSTNKCSSCTLNNLYFKNADIGKVCKLHKEGLKSEDS